MACSHQQYSTWYVPLCSTFYWFPQYISSFAIKFFKKAGKSSLSKMPFFPTSASALAAILTNISLSDSLYSPPVNSFCGSVMIQSGSGSSYEFLEFRIRIHPYYLSMFGRRRKKNLKIYHKRRFYRPSAIFQLILQFYSTQSEEFKGIKFEIFICTFIFCWIRVRNYPRKNSRSGSTRYSGFFRQPLAHQPQKNATTFQKFRIFQF